MKCFVYYMITSSNTINSSKTKSRLFIAFEIPPSAKNIINSTIALLKKCNFNIKWTSLNNLHLTLVFLGDVSRDRVSLLREIIDFIAINNLEFDIEINDKLEFFGPISNPRVLLIGFSKGNKELSSIYSTITRILSKHNFSLDEKKYLPHLTLGRFKSNKNVNLLQRNSNLNQYKTQKFKLQKITLFKSELTSSGPIYTKIHEVKLKTL